VKREQLQKEVYGLKKPGKQPNKIVNDDGSVTEVPATYTPEEFKKHEEEMKSYNKRLKEMTESLERFDKNLEEAFTNPTDKAFEKLEKISKGAQPE
jgi:galactokinase